MKALDLYLPIEKEGNSGVFNWGGWSFPELDALVQKAGKELDTATRLGYETEALQIVKDEHIMLPLHQQPMAWAVSDKVAEMPLFPDNKPRLWFTQMSE